MATKFPSKLASATSKRSRSPTLSLSPAPPPADRSPTPPPTKKRKKWTSQHRDAFQQVTQAGFSDKYRIRAMGFGGEVFYKPDFIDPLEANVWYDVLLKLDTSYGTEPDMTLNYSGSEITIHHPYPPVLARMQERLEELLGFHGETFWSPLARGADWSTENFKGADVGGQTPLRHSDNLNNLVIASVSLGAERTFNMSPRLPSKSTPKKRQLSADEERSLQGRKNVRLTLANGSLLVMQGRTQEFWKVGWPKPMPLARMLIAPARDPARKAYHARPDQPYVPSAGLKTIVLGSGEVGGL
ncbi:hypothetical protein JCM24511_01852 [Saitozyma sp. JCM 24511]|nr:hypothetical protein JCM24511_01852 [Saitozyma sp. JCM 24511]